MNELILVRSSKLFGALAHPARLQILEMLAHGEACVCHLSAALHQRQAYISQQLARLKEEGLIADRKDGLFVYYRLADASIVQLTDQAREVLARTTGDPSFRQREVRRSASDACSCPACRAAARRAQATEAAIAETTGGDCLWARAQATGPHARHRTRHDSRLPA